MTSSAILLTLATILTLLTPQNAPRFRSRTDIVTVSVAVKKGNDPVANLTAADFRLFDNDVAQSIEAVTIESVPLDVTLFMDTSGSTSGELSDMTRNVRSIAGMLRPTDRFRLLTIGLAVNESVPWRAGGPLGPFPIEMVPGISLVYDALLAGFAHQPETGRRHLMVAMTDARDCGSIVPGSELLEASKRSEAVLHHIYVSGSASLGEHSIAAFCTPDDTDDNTVVVEAAEASGGASHRSRFGDPTVRTFARILNDFRQSYVLRYSLAGVPGPGWHRIRVEVPGRKGVRVEARSGYYR